MDNFSEKENSYSTGEMKEEELAKCPYCGSTDLEIYNDKLICLSCGSVIFEDIVDTDYETRVFDASDIYMKRTASSTTPGSIEIHSIKIKDSEGKTRYLQKESRTKNLLSALGYLNELTVKLNLSKDVKEQVQYYLKQYIMKRSVRKDRIKALVVALIYITARILGQPRPLDFLVKATGLKKKEINKAYKLVRETLKLEIPVIDPEKFILTFGKELGLTGETIKVGLEIIKRIRSLGEGIGRDPAGVAAAAIYIATKLTGERRTQKRIADVAGVTEVTVRNRYREICERLGLELDED